MTEAEQKIVYWAVKSSRMYRCIHCRTRYRARSGACCSGRYFYVPSLKTRPVINPLTGQIKETQIPYVMPQAQRLARKSGHNKEARAWARYVKSLDNPPTTDVRSE